MHGLWESGLIFRLESNVATYRTRSACDGDTGNPEDLGSSSCVGLWTDFSEVKFNWDLLNKRSSLTP